MAISYARRISYNRVLKEMCDLWPLLRGLPRYHFFQHVQTGLAPRTKARSKNYFSGSPESVRDLWFYFVTVIQTF